MLVMIFNNSTTILQIKLYCINFNIKRVQNMWYKIVHRSKYMDRLHIHMIIDNIHVYNNRKHQTSYHLNKQPAFNSLASFFGSHPFPPIWIVGLHDFDPYLILLLSTLGILLLLGLFFDWFSMVLLIWIGIINESYVLFVCFLCFG